MGHFMSKFGQFSINAGNAGKLGHSAGELGSSARQVQQGPADTIHDLCQCLTQHLRRAQMGQRHALWDMTWAEGLAACLASHIACLCLVQEKEQLKAEKDAAEAKYKVALVDGKQEQVHCPLV